VPQQSRDLAGGNKRTDDLERLADLSGSEHMLRDVVKRQSGAHAYLPTPVTTGATWRLLGAVLFTAVDKGAGVIQTLVSNSLPHAVNAYLTWSFAGVTGISTLTIEPTKIGILEIDLPAGFSGSVEIFAKNA
jgi:hypothetical protein